MSAQHTPGPWVVYEHRGHDDEPVVAVRWSANGLTLAHLVNYNAPERRANAHLIAAAPELLAALQLTLGALTCCAKPAQCKGLAANARDAARAAIAKATGGAT